MKAVNLWVTDKCNLACRYCYEKNQSTKKKMMTRNDAMDIIAFLSKNDTSMVNFHGGEPLLNYDFISFFCEHYSKIRKNTTYSFTTNGLLLNDSIIDDIKKKRIAISISLDGEKDSHDLNRRDIMNLGTYDRCIFNALKLLKAGIDVRIRMTIVPSTASNLYKNVTHLYERGFRTIVAVPDFFSKEWNESYFEIIKINVCEIEKWRKGKNLDFVFLEEGLISKGRCMGGIQECSIDPYLDIYPCTYTVGNLRWKLGSVHEGIQENLIEKIRSLWTIENQVCAGCKMEKFCISTRCKLINESITGSVNTPAETICAFENLVYSVYHFLNHKELRKEGNNENTKNR